MTSVYNYDCTVPMTGKVMAKGSNPGLWPSLIWVQSQRHSLTHQHFVLSRVLLLLCYNHAQVGLLTITIIIKCVRTAKFLRLRVVEVSRF